MFWTQVKIDAIFWKEKSNYLQTQISWNLKYKYEIFNQIVLWKLREELSNLQV